jgi:phosphatidylglycerophosphate synthase
VLAATVASLAIAELAAALAGRALHLSPVFAFKTAVIFLTGMLVAATRVAAHHPHPTFGAANTVTSVRLALVALLAASLGEPYSRPLAWAATLLAVLLSVLDGVDGWLARRASRSSAFGARFDMETDAWLIMVLSALAWRWERAGAWVLACGLMRYAFVAAAWAWPWLARPLPPRVRRKVVAVVQMVGLAIVIAPIVPPPLSQWLAAITLSILAWSFAVDVWWLAARPTTRRPPPGAIGG